MAYAVILGVLAVSLVLTIWPFEQVRDVFLAARKRRLVKRTALQAKGARLLLTEIVFILVALIAVTLVTIEVVNPSIRIESVAVPEDLAKAGFTQEALGKLVRSELRRIAIRAADARVGPNARPQDYWPERDLPKIVVPGTDLGISEIARQIRRLLHIDALEVSIFVERRGKRLATLVSSTPTLSHVGGEWIAAADTRDVVHKVAEQIVHLTQPYMLAEYLQQTGRDEECLRLIAEIQASFPPRHEWHLRSHLLAAIVHRTRKDHELAFREVRRAISIDPEFAPAYNALGNAFWNSGDRKSAIAAYEKAVALDTVDPVARINLAYLFSEEGDLERAIRTYRKSAEIDPTFAYARHYLAVALTNAGRLAEAVAASRMAIKLDDQRTEFHWQLGKELRLLDRVEEARVACRRSEQLDEAKEMPPCRSPRRY